MVDSISEKTADKVSNKQPVFLTTNKNVPIAGLTWEKFLNSAVEAFNVEEQSPNSVNDFLGMMQDQTTIPLFDEETLTPALMEKLVYLF